MTQQNTAETVALDSFAGKATSAREARAQAAELIAFAEMLEQEIKEAMGDARKATIFGVPYFTYQPKNAYSWRKFEDDHPHIARSYKTVQEVEVLDKEKLLAEQGDILANYQTREFRWVNKKPGA